MIAARHALEPRWSVRQLCRTLAISRSSISYTPVEPDDLDVRAELEAIALAFPRYGYRRMTVELRRRGLVVNHKRVLRLLRAANLLVDVRAYCRTTDSRHTYGRYPNRVKGLVVTHPDHVWAADITYVRLQQDFIYLAVLLDLYTRGIRGWELGRRLTSDLPLTALERALAAHRPTIHHSDQGVQYAAHDYIAVLEAHDVTISMAAVGRPTDNAIAERFRRTLKEEEVYLHDYRDIADARASIGRFLDEVYQTKRIHSALGYLTPAEFEAACLVAVG
jgi:transposase InsO family protein